MRSALWITFPGLLMAMTASFAAGQSAQEWNAYKAQCGLSSSLDYNSWVKSGSPCNSSTSSPNIPTAKGGLTQGQQQLATAIGQAGANLVLQSLQNLFSGQPTQPTAPLDPAAQQRLLAAQQLNNSGIYLYQHGDYLGALNEFQKALALDPNDRMILSNERDTKQKLQERAQAAATSEELSSLLGSAPNPVNENPGAASIDAVLHGSDGDVVNLAGTTRTTVGPAVVQGQIDALFGKPAPSASDIDSIFQESRSKTNALNAQCASAPAGSAASASCQQQAEQLKNAQKRLDGLTSAPVSAGPHN